MTVLKEITNPDIVVIKHHEVSRTMQNSDIIKNSQFNKTILAKVIQKGENVDNVEVGDTIVIGTLKGSIYKDYRLVYRHDYVAKVQ